MNQRVLFLLILLGVVLYGLFVWVESPPFSPLIGKKIPDIEVEKEDDSRVSPRNFQGKVVLVHFWATWCPPCSQEMPILDRLYKTLPQDKFVLLAISVDEDEEKSVNEFRKRVPFSFPVYYDHDQKLSVKMGTFGLPETYLVDPNGVILRKAIGPQNWMSPAWQAEFKKWM